MIDERIEMAQQIVRLIAQGDFAAVEEHLADNVKALLPASRMQATWQQIQRQAGAFKQQVEAHTVQIEQGQVQIVTCAFAHTQLDVNIMFNVAGKVVGLNITPAGTVEQQAHITYDPPSYAHAEQFHEHDVQVGQGEWALPGTLSIPVGEGPFRAVVLVHGSGPQDRDETIPPNKPFRDLAWGLASQGIAVLRYDKRTKVHGAKMDVASVTVKEETIDDALAAVALLRTRPEIDSQHIFVLGHSLGGFVAPRIAVADPAIGGLIIMAGSARPFEDVILDQMSYIFSLSDADPSEKAQQIDLIKKEVALVKSPELSSETSADELPLGVHPAYWLDLRNYHPEQVARTLKQPILILQADADYQVTLDDFQIWQSALSDRRDVTFKHYPGLHHMFMSWKEGKKATPAAYSIPGHVEQIVVDDIAQWIKAQ